MGSQQSRIDGYCRASLGPNTRQPEWALPHRKLRTTDDLKEALRNAGLENIGELIFAADMTASNEENGARTFGGKCLHTLQAGVDNPYQVTMRAAYACLSKLQDTKSARLLKFGCSETRHHSTKLVSTSSSVDGLMSAYSNMVRRSHKSGPTSFAAIVRDAAKIVRDSGRRFSVLVVICDGQVSEAEHCWEETEQAIVEAAEGTPLAIVIVGVGDGPWEDMEDLDDQLPRRKFDNVQFMKAAPFQAVLQNTSKRDEAVTAAFALCICQELAAQYKACDDLGLLGRPEPGAGGHEAKRARVGAEPVLAD